MGYVYILQSLKNSRYYIGSTNDLKRRFDQHQSGYSGYTRNNRPFKLVFNQKYLTLNEARRAEAWLKKQKDRKLLEQIIEQKEIKKPFC
jgi:putative endonuclease